MSTKSPRFATVILDADSTLSGIEGIDWLAARREPAVAAAVVAQTEAAMRGELPLEDVYGRRLSLVAPSVADLEALAQAYIDALATDASEVIDAGRAAGVRWLIVSGGIRAALLPMAARLGIAPEDVFAVEVYHDAAGAYRGFDTESPLARGGGKPAVVAALSGVARPLLAVGDGETDAQLRPVVDAFWAYTGFTARPRVVAQADRAVASFGELWSLLGTEAS